MATEMLWVSLEGRSRTYSPPRFHSQLCCQIVRYFCRTLYKQCSLLHVLATYFGYLQGGVLWRIYYTKCQNNLQIYNAKFYITLLKYKLLMKLFVLNCVLIYCMYGDTIQAKVVVLWLLVSLYFLFIDASWWPTGVKTYSQFRIIKVLFCIFWSLHSWRTWWIRRQKDQEVPQWLMYRHSWRRFFDMSLSWDKTRMGSGVQPSWAAESKGQRIESFMTKIYILHST